MLSPPRRVWIPLLLVVGLSSQAFAWVPKTRVRMTDEAVRFMPPTLRKALEKHRSAVLRGMLDPMKAEDSAEHLAPGSAGTLDQTVQSEAQKLAAMLSEQTPFSKIAEQFGRLGHYVLDSGFPPGVGSDGSSRYDHFGKFCEDRLERFRLVFYGHENDTLAKQDYRGYALETIARAQDSDTRLAYVYNRVGEHPHASDFDDRSVPFAIGSISYSRSINDLVRVWLSVWENAGGDMGHTPYRNMNQTGRQ